MAADIDGERLVVARVARIEDVAGEVDRLPRVLDRAADLVAVLLECPAACTLERVDLSELERSAELDAQRALLAPT